MNTDQPTLPPLGQALPTPQPNNCEWNDSTNSLPNSDDVLQWLHHDGIQEPMNTDVYPNINDEQFLRLLGDSSLRGSSDSHMADILRGSSE
jgi:hypothetical protein